MKKLIYAINLILFFIFILAGCSINPENSVTSSDPDESSNSLYWATENGIFYTKDLARAQQEIPYKIILPDYFPGVQGVLLPNIKGPLRGNTIHGGKEVEIYYTPKPNDDDSPLIRIFETDQDFSLGDPQLDPTLEKITIQNMQVLKRKGEDFGIGQSNNFSFNANGVYFVVEIYGYPENEAIKIIESMIKQME